MHQKHSGLILWCLAFLCPITWSLSRSCWPKTKQLKATDKHPLGPKTIKASFRWAPNFVGRVMKEFGPDQVLPKFKDWRWDVSTCFSGIGCAETVAKLRNMFRVYFLSAPSSVLLNVVTWCNLYISDVETKALLSLENAVAAEMSKSGCGFRANSHVNLMFGVERDARCQKVLAQTYGTCVFSDVMELSRKKRKLNCVTHGKQCACQVEPHSKRSMSEWLQFLLFGTLYWVLRH